MKIKKLLHSSILVRDVKQSLLFYRDVLGMTVSQERPNFDYDGAWLQIGEQQIHLIQLPNPDPIEGRPAHGGMDRHIALEIDDLADLRSTLDKAEVSYTLSRSGRPALFCRDRDGNALEFIQP